MGGWSFQPGILVVRVRQLPTGVEAYCTRRVRSRYAPAVARISLGPSEISERDRDQRSKREESLELGA